MLDGRAINIDFDRENNGQAIVPSDTIQGSGPSRLSAARLAIFGISAREAEFSVRGFRPTSAERRDRLEAVGRTFIAGYNSAVTTGQGDAAVERLGDVPEALRGFFVEGAAMGLALLDLVTPWRRRGFAAFVEGPAQPYIYLAHVGAGWALARTSWRLRRRLGRVDPLLSWLMMDGYGFHAGYFQPNRTIDLHRRPRLPRGYAARAFDQGLGRALWFAMGASGEAVRDSIEGFAPERRPDLWSGVGLAVTYAGGAETAELSDLAAAAGDCRLDLAQGAAFAAAAHLRAGPVPSHTEAACRLLCGMEGRSAAAITTFTRPDPRSDPAGRHYEAWRSAIRSGIADRSDARQPAGAAGMTAGAGS